MKHWSGILGFILCASQAWGQNFTQGTGTAQKFGTHEIVLTGNGSVSNPFDTGATVTFTPPSGSANAKTVYAFYDGGNTWRARLYVTETGTWQWSSTSATDAGLNGRSGTISAVNSALRGIVKHNLSNPKALMTDNGQWYAIISDTGYMLFNPGKTAWQQFVTEDAAHGINSIIAGSFGQDSLLSMDPTPTKYDPWLGVGSVDYTRYDLPQFQLVDTRLQWILNNYPDMHIELLVLSEGAYGSDGSAWLALSSSIRQNTMRYMLARWGAYPNLLFEVS